MKDEDELDREYLRELIIKYLSDQATEEEKDSLENYFLGDSPFIGT